MQIKNNKSNYLQNPWIIGLIKLLLLVGCLVFIGRKFQHQSISLHNIDWPENFGLTFGVVCILMVFNWYLEALRWKVSTEVFEPLSLKNAWKVVLGGLTLNWVVPFTTGDLIARLSIPKDKYQASSAAVLNRAIMMLFTLLIGFYGTSFVAESIGINGWYTLGILIVIPIFRNLFKRTFKRFFTYFGELSKNTLGRIIGISFLRYLVFVFQFYLLLSAFLPGIESRLLVAGIGWIFLIRSSLPLFFGGVGVREASGIVFFEPYVANIELVVVPIFLIWIINTVFPSVVGLLVILNSKSLLFQPNDSTS